MTAKQSIIKFMLPIGGLKKETLTDYYQALAKASGGFYPIGKNQLWHGGIHFDKTVLAELGATSDNIPVQAIADGEVVAYRLDNHYQPMTYANKALTFSSSFVLLRHQLVMPLPPASQPAPESQKTQSSTTIEKDKNNNPLAANLTAPEPTVLP